jgi:hypothetical protein
MSEQFLYDREGLTKVLQAAYRLGMSRAANICVPDLWKDSQKQAELEREFKSYFENSQCHYYLFPEIDLLSKSLSETHRLWWTNP